MMTKMAKMSGMIDALPNTVARMTGAMTLARKTLTGEQPPVAPQPFDTLCGLGCSRLVRYRSTAARAFAEPIVLVPSLINRPYILDIMAGNSVVRTLLDAGFAVYLVDWGEPETEEDQAAGFDAYTSRLREFVRAACADALADKAHLFGQCLGGTLCTALAAVDDESIQSLVNLTAPIGFHDKGMLSAWSRAPFFDAAAFAELYGNVPVWITQPSFMILKPLGQPTKMMRLFQNLGNEQFLDFYRCLEAWINDNVKIPKAFYVDLIDVLYREDGLLGGKLKVLGRPVVLEEVKVPVMTVAATEDHIVPLQSALAGHARFGATDKEAVEIAGGHIGVVVGGRGRRELSARVIAFYRARSTAQGIA